jgi:hypothetical protein
MQLDINIVNLNDIDLNRIKFSKSSSINKDQKKISIGYDSHIDLHIQTPLLTSTMNYTKSFNNLISIRFDPMLGQILLLYKFIIDIEKHISNHILRHNHDYKLCTIIKSECIDLFDDNKDNYTKYILLNAQLTKFYNNINEPTVINQIKNKSKYKALLNIESIWINTTSKKFGLKIEPIQIKIIEPLSTNMCLIDYNPENQIDTNKKKITNNQSSILTNSTFIPTPTPTQTQTQTTNILVQQQPIIIDKIIFKPPDPSQLLQLKNSLKKIID